MHNRMYEMWSGVSNDMMEFHFFVLSQTIINESFYYANYFDVEFIEMDWIKDLDKLTSFVLLLLVPINWMTSVW